MGLSLGLSVVILGLVLSVAGPGGVVAAAGPLLDTPFTDGGGGVGTGDPGFHVLSLPGAGDSAVSSQASERASGPTFLISGTHQAGACSLCASDPSYDPEMGFFTVTLSTPVTQEGFTFCRYPCMNDTHDISPLDGGLFLLWFHREKGCGDFQMWGTSGGISNTNVLPLNIPCTGGLARDTLPRRWGDYSLGSFAPDPFDPMADNQTIYSRGPGSFAIVARNATATWMQVSPIAFSTSCNGVPLGPPPVYPNGDLPKWIEPGSTVPFAFGIGNSPFAQAECPRAPNAWEVGVTASSPVQITATLVFSLGPTARISQTMVLARPDSAYLPLAEKGQDGGW